MELSKLRKRPITERFEDGDDGFDITWNRNAFTPDFLRIAARQIRKLASSAVQKPKGKSNRRNEKAKPDSTAEVLATGLEIQADVLEIEREVYASMLSGHGAKDEDAVVLQEWGVKDKGQPTKPTYEVLKSLHPRTVKGLWEWCIERSSTVKKPETAATEASPTTLETTGVGSAESPSVESPTM